MVNNNIYPTFPTEISALLEPQSYHLNVIQSKQEGLQTGGKVQEEVWKVH